MAIDLGPTFEQNVAQLAGIDTYDAGTLEIPFLNPNGDTTVRLTVSKNVDTTALKGLIQTAAQ